MGTYALGLETKVRLSIQQPFQISLHTFDLAQISLPYEIIRQVSLSFANVIRLGSQEM